MKIKIKSFPQIYTGDSINPRRLFFIKNDIRKGKGGYFIITPSESDEYSLEIIASKYLGGQIYKGRTFILGGIASDKAEGFELIRRITEDCLRKRGDLNLKEFISCGRYY